MKPKVLFLDDEQNVLDAFKRQLRGRFDMDMVSSGSKALEMLDENGPYWVVVSDMRMPEMDGVEFLSRVQEKAPETIRLMLTGNVDQETAVKAVNEGRVFQFLNKPCSPEDLAHAIQNGIQQYQLLRAEKELLANTLNGCIRILTDILSTAAPQVFAHSQSLKEAVKSLSPALKGGKSWELELAAMLSSIGFVTIPAETLEKHRKAKGLTGNEKDMLERIPEIGSRLVGSIPRLENVAKLVLYQNKRYDGSGFPNDSLSGTDIPEGARKLKILSDLVRLESKGHERLEALELLTAHLERYDPEMLDQLIAYTKSHDECSVADRLTIQFSELITGDILVSDIESTDGLTIVPKGNEISQLILEKLRNVRRMVDIKEPLYIKKAVYRPDSRKL